MMLRHILQRLFPALKTQQTCPACGRAFTCGVSLRGCWCAGVTLSDEQRAVLRQRYDLCLCPACLEKFARDTNA
jgi:hypothetical protein